MTKPVPVSVFGRPDRTHCARAIFKARLALTLSGVVLFASLAEGQTYQRQRVPQRTTATRATPGANQTTSLASYVSGYTGEGQPGSPARPAVPGAAPSFPSESYEIIEPGTPVAPGGVPVGPMAGPVIGGDCDTCGPMGDCCDGAPCWGPGDCFGGDCYPFLQPLRERVWVEADYLLWWLKSYSVPPLVTNSVDTVDANTTLFGNQNLGNRNHSGVRIGLGWWIDPCHTAALEVIYTHISEDSTLYQSGAVTNGVLARPFYDSGEGRLATWTLALPGSQQGWAEVRATNEFHTLEALVRRQLFQTCTSRTDLLLGYRYAELYDRLAIRDHRLYMTNSVPPIQAGDTINQFDWFDTNNTFHGVEIGFSSEIRYLRWSMDLLMKLALGNTRSQTTIDGESLYNNAHWLDSGLLTQKTNIGHMEQDSFTVVPELGVKIGYDITRRLRGTVGYSLLYWSKVVRAGDQIDYNVNVPLVPDTLPDGAQQPAAPFKTTDFWAQGLSFGLEYHF